MRTLCIKHVLKAKLQGERKFPDKYESKGGNKNKSNKKMLKKHTWGKETPRSHKQ